MIVSTTFLYHNFDNIRSYASKGVADIRSIPPKGSKLKIALAIQCKNTKKFDYIDPVERQSLLEFSKKFEYLVIEIFKKDRQAFVKIKPWNLKGKIMKPEEFLKLYYGIEADSWSLWRKNWFREGIKRKPKTNI